MEELKSLTDTLIREMKANTAEVTGLRLEQQKVLTEHRALRRSNKRERNWRRAAIVFVVAAIMAVLVTNHLRGRHEKKLSDDQAADLKCISAYENANRSRTVTLTALTGPRNAALAAAIAALGKLTMAATDPHLSPVVGEALLADFNRKQAAFLKADAAYTKALVDNPVPAPVFKCSDRLDSAKAAADARATVTATPAAPAPATTVRSVRVAVPTTVLMPGRTVSVPQPARTVVVTRVRTVTRTVTPPSCIPALKPPCVIGLPK